MVWFKVDDGFAFHPKTLEAGNAALGLWVRAGSWCGQQLSDGLVPVHMVRPLGGKPRDAQQLVDAGLWDRTDTGDYQFHDWGAFQPVKQAVLANRKASVARQSVFKNPELRHAIRLRDGDACRYCGRTVHWTDRRGDLGGTYDHVIPDGPSDLGNLVVACRGCNARKGRHTPQQVGMVLRSEPKSDLSPDLLITGPRPDPTRPDPVLPTEVPTDNETTSRERATRLPSDWQPSLDLVDWVKSECPGVDARHETAQFRDYWISKSGRDATKVDWPATYRRWMRTAQERAPTGRTSTRHDENADAVRRMQQREQAMHLQSIEAR